MSEQTDRGKDFGRSIKEVSLLGLFDGNNLVIPEIQREYVWGDKIIGRRVLRPFFRDFLKSVGEFEKKKWYFESKSEKLRETIIQALGGTCYGIADENLTKRLSAFSDGVAQDMLSDEGIRLDSRVGFIYAYIPGFAKDVAERILPAYPAYLIDGQQRVTTFFLMWLHLAKKAGKIEEFKTDIRYDEVSLAFDFKVRPLTHEFVNQLVKEVVKCENDFDFKFLEDATWFLSEYRHDVSVMSMVNALKVWVTEWEDSKLDACIAYEYLTKHVKFWLFVMNETAQGEQLYITMNGRGKPLSEDEIIRAKVFRDAVSNGHVATEVGQLFESMTDFFWTNRVKNELNADKGMKKFFRWVHLLERYNNEFPDDKREHERRQEQDNRSDFALALRNDHGADAKGFELDETMFGQDENTKAPRITFDLIQSTFENLEELFRADSPALQYLRPTILEEGDRGDSFQQDCFVLLPLLHWLNGVRKGGRQHDKVKLAQLARYLRKMLSKNDVQRRVGVAIPVALRFAETFAKFQSGDLLDFIREGGKLDSENEGYRLEVLPEEELHKAKCLVAVRNEDGDLAEDQKLFPKFEKLLNDIEDYKSTNGGQGRFSADYQISSFLNRDKDTQEKLEDINIPEWWAVTWDKDMYEKYGDAFFRFKRFWERPNSIRKFRLLLEFGGYYETNLKLFPHSLVEVMDNAETVGKIIGFEEKVDKLGEDQAFVQYDKEFLNKHWRSRNENSNSRDLCALALIVQCLSGTGFVEIYNKVQFEHRYYVNKEIPVNHQMRSIGKPGLYFWFLSGNASRWRYSEATNDHLLAYHVIGDEAADSLVQQFLEKDTNA